MYEIWHTFKTGGVERLYVIANDIDHESLGGILLSVSIGKAEATVVADRDRILSEIKSDFTFKELNANIKTSILRSAQLEYEQTSHLNDENIDFNSCEKYALLLFYQGQRDLPAMLYLRMLRHCKTVFGTNHANTAKALQGVAMTTKGEMSLDFSLQLLQVYQELYGENDEKIKLLLHKIAISFFQLKQYEKALEYYQKLNSFENIGICQIKLGNISLGKENIMKAIQEKNEVRNVASTLKSAAKAFIEVEQYEEATTLIMRALGILEKIDRKEAQGYNYIEAAEMLTGAKKYEEAIEMYKYAIAVQETYYDRFYCYADTVSAVEAIIQILESIGKSQEIASYMEKLDNLKELEASETCDDDLDSYY